MWFPSLTISLQLVNGKLIATNCHRLTSLPRTPMSPAMSRELLWTDTQASEGGVLVTTTSAFSTPAWHHRANHRVSTAGKYLEAFWFLCVALRLLLLSLFKLSGQLPASCLANTVHPNLPEAISHDADEVILAFLLLPRRNDSQHQKSSIITKNIRGNKKSNMTSNPH